MYMNNLEEDKVSIIIATYNRFSFLLNTIKTVKEQTYKNIEIIVINDCSSQKEYYDYDFETNGVKIIHLEKNSKVIHGFACPGGYQRNFGIGISTGKYIAFCDDDDVWFPDKLKLQINQMKNTDCKMSCTEALIGKGVFNQDKKYLKYNAEYAFVYITNVYKGTPFFKNGTFPIIWNLEFLQKNNCCICSSVVIEKTVIEKTGMFKSLPTADDYEYWLRILEHTNCVYIPIPCVYYDSGHGDGQNYNTTQETIREQNKTYTLWKPNNYNNNL